MKPTRSAKRTETRRRSGRVRGRRGSRAAARRPSAASAVPHSPQNRSPGSGSASRTSGRRTLEGRSALAAELPARAVLGPQVAQVMPSTCLIGPRARARAGRARVDAPSRSKISRASASNGAPRRRGRGREPLAVLEQRDREPEGDIRARGTLGRALERARLRPRLAPRRAAHGAAEPARRDTASGRPGGTASIDASELLRLVRVAERERGLDRLDEPSFTDPGCVSPCGRADAPSPPSRASARRSSRPSRVRQRLTPRSYARPVLDVCCVADEVA